MGVSNQEGAEDGIHDGVEGAGGERSNAEGDQADADSSVDRTISGLLDRMVRVSRRTSRKSSDSYPPWGEGWEREPGRSLSKPVRVGFNGRFIHAVYPRIALIFDP